MGPFPGAGYDPSLIALALKSLKGQRRQGAFDVRNVEQFGIDIFANVSPLGHVDFDQEIKIAAG